MFDDVRDALAKMTPEQIAASPTKAQREAGWSAYLAACQKEIEVCPHCETWLLSECLVGRGCPTPDGLNGQRIRAILAAEQGDG